MKYTITLLCFILASACCYGQRLKTPTLSPQSKISQEIGLTELTLEYSRPSAKAREVFGSLVPYGKMWRTGANASTKITLTESAHIGKNLISPGTYALYTIPGREVWTIIIHSNTKLRSLAGDAYDPVDDVFRFEVKPQRVEDYMETFTIQFSELKSNSCQLHLIWENTKVNIPIEVEVDSKVVGQMADYLKNPESIPHRTYFEAAQYYINNDRSLDEALSFINSALEKSPKNFRYGLLKSKIQDENGDRKAALITVNSAHDWAKDAKNDNYIEQTDLFRQFLMSN